MTLHNLVVYLNKQSLEYQQDFYLLNKFHTNKPEFLKSPVDNKISYSSDNSNNTLIEISFAYFNPELIKDLLKYTVKDAFDFASELSNEAFDKLSMNKFYDSVLGAYNNYVSYVEQEDKQNTVDLLVYIVCSLVKQHILTNGNKRAIFTFIVYFLRYFCGLYLKWTDLSQSQSQQPFNEPYSITIAQWVEQNKSNDLHNIIKEFIIQNSIIPFS
ncbi:hypothetical protein [Mycoplasma sp. 3686d]|uniref:hypothetical protein n=1 Tax=Mycoplasma sp. 3686d TaxID=2967300 RepID=UPI00211D05AD|nr:hypothetical protein [Mycoplasma sp. 3686d]UUM24534.1 hypothetical protein NPA12_02430 [Mycoplasma sp. 3686d]